MNQDDYRIVMNNFDVVKRGVAKNKSDIENIYIKNSVGYIPDLSTDINSNGFKISAYNSASEIQAFYSFTSWKTEWKPIDAEVCWLQIDCTNSMRIHKFALAGCNTISTASKFENWKLQCTSK